jgi:hypothetical protein
MTVKKVGGGLMAVNVTAWIVFDGDERVGLY